MDHLKQRKAIPGTTVFDGSIARNGYALNKMCFSFNSEQARTEFQNDPESYMTRFNLNDEQKSAIRSKNVLDLIKAGGHPYYLAKFAGIFKLDMQDIGAQQTGVSKAEFQQKLLQAGK